MSNEKLVVTAKDIEQTNDLAYRKIFKVKESTIFLLGERHESCVISKKAYNRFGVYLKALIKSDYGNNMKVAKDAQINYFNEIKADYLEGSNLDSFELAFMLISQNESCVLLYENRVKPELISKQNSVIQEKHFESYYKSFTELIGLGETAVLCPLNKFDIILGSLSSSNLNVLYPNNSFVKTDYRSRNRLILKYYKLSLLVVYRRMDTFITYALARIFDEDVKLAKDNVYKYATNLTLLPFINFLLGKIDIIVDQIRKVWNSTGLNKEKFKQFYTEFNSWDTLKFRKKGNYFYDFIDEYVLYDDKDWLTVLDTITIINSMYEVCEIYIAVEEKSPNILSFHGAHHAMIQAAFIEFYEK